MEYIVQCETGCVTRLSYQLERLSVEDQTQCGALWMNEQS